MIDCGSITRDELPLDAGHSYSVVKLKLQISIKRRLWFCKKPWVLIYQTSGSSSLRNCTDQDLVNTLLPLLRSDRVTLVDLDPKVLKLDPKLQAELIARELLR